MRGVGPGKGRFGGLLQRTARAASPTVDLKSALLVIGCVVLWHG
jgi:hypothetical protein